MGNLTAGVRVLLLLVAVGWMMVSSLVAKPAKDFESAPTIVWRFSVGSPIFSSPVTSDSAIYFGSVDGKLYAVDLYTGKANWIFGTEGEIRSTVCLDGDRLYLVSGDGKCYAIDRHTGNEIWAFATRGEIKHDFADYYQSSPVVHDDQLYFGSGDGNVYALDTKDGSVLWSFATGGAVHAAPAIDNNRVFIGSFDGYFYALDAMSGALVWKFKSVGHRYFPKGAFTGSPVAADGIVVVGARDYNLYAIDQQGGHCVWNKAFARGWALPNTVRDSVLYTGTSDDRVLVASNLQTGREYWRVNLRFNIFGGLATSQGMGYVGTLMGKLYGIDLITGAVRWTISTDGYQKNHLKYFKADDSFRDDIFEIVKSDEAFIDVEYELGAIFSTPLISGSYLVVTSTDGTVYCFKRQ